MDVRKIKKLIELLESSSLSEIEISEGEESIRITKQLTVKNEAANLNQVTVEQNSEINDKNKQDPSGALGVEINSPMVGTFYTSPKPGSKPYVSIGSNIDPGDTVCIIEAMKMMNQIESEIKGKVVSILVENGSPIEYGQPLFIVEPS